ncbi:MAG: transposase, partial [Saprospirales bacterium]
MFKRSYSTAPDLFNGILSVSGEEKSTELSCPEQMHNVFCQEVTNRIDESVFSDLYSSENGRPNASIRRLVAMKVLKEGERWTDEQLFNSCKYDLRVMLNLGLNNISDEVVCNSTYYYFKSALERHKVETGMDLLERCFEQLTLDQKNYHGVSGERIQLDSKLIQSNIAKSSRLGLLLEGLRKYISPDVDLWKEKVSFSDQE